MIDAAPTDNLAPFFADRTVLITGGTGSFGHQFVDLIRRYGCKEIRILSRDELKQEHMRVELGDARLKFHLGDVRDRVSVDAVMQGVNYVFHAAALKQVPSCEFFPMQAVATNIVGSHNVIESAIVHGVSRLVCLSTDKAAYPVNAMGMTKALMEKVLQAAARRLVDATTILSSVRYGNVMYSRGSVIPLFIQQIRGGRPITVTVPEMTRFLLPLPQAIELVAFALRHAGQGDLMVRKAPACTIEVLADALKQLFKSDTPINVIGIRHGEKLYETLATREELGKAQDMGDYYRIVMDDRDLNYGRYVSQGDAREAQLSDYTSHNTQHLNREEVVEMLLSLPEVRLELAEAGCL